MLCVGVRACVRMCILIGEVVVIDYVLSSLFGGGNSVE